MPKATADMPARNHDIHTRYVRPWRLSPLNLGGGAEQIREYEVNCRERSADPDPQDACSRSQPERCTRAKP